MRLPRDISGSELAAILKQLGYEVTRQSGSHMRLTTEQNGAHHVTIPKHNSIRLGTLYSILNEVAEHFELSRDNLLKQLFGNLWVYQTRDAFGLRDLPNGWRTMPIVDQINRDLTEAMKAQQAERLSTIRMVKTALKLRETELPAGVDDTEAIKVLTTLLKQRRDAAEQYRAGHREDLAQKEEREALIIQTYLPAAASEGDLSRAVDEVITEMRAASMKDMGAVMKAVRSKLEGNTVDGKALSHLVKSKLS